MDKYLEQNKQHWNEITSLHAQSEFYDVSGFKAGRCALKPTELQEMGDVKGKSLLHLQCHFGLDTLSWGRLGAEVTGADFSEDAVRLARELSKETGIKAEFIQSDIYALPEVLNKKFDIVLTSYGVLCWLPELKKWAQTISHFLKRGGVFYIVEFHPVQLMFDDSITAEIPQIALSYFRGDKPLEFPSDRDYATGSATKTGTYQWQYPLGNIVTAIIEAGLHIEFLHEFPFTTYKALPFMKQDKDGNWRIDGDPLPLLFSLKAIKTH